MEIIAADRAAGQSPTALLDAMGEVTKQRRLHEVRELEMLALWADIHSGDGETDEALIRQGLMNQLGGEGTPLVIDHCLGEPALLRGVGVMSIMKATADVLDLKHRLPNVWAVTCQGLVDVWLPRRVAKLSRHLPVERIALVDEAIAPLLGHEGPGRILEITTAKVIEADPGTHQERVEAEKKRRYVALNRSDEYGLRTLIARIEAGDAAWIDATITRVVEIIRDNHEDAGADELRAIAFGYLARPAELLALLTENVDAEEQLHRAIAVPVDVLDKLNSLNLKALAPKVVLYAHLHEAALLGVSAAARIEGLGPATLTQLRAFLAGCQVSVKPVIDLSDRVRATAYEHPEGLKERVHLITGGDYFPYANSTSRDTDYDHVTAYAEDGPPGQTGTHNSGPLIRRHHRMKTFSRYRSRQAGQGRYVWITPNGLAFLVDHNGTTPIPATDAAAVYDAPPGIDLHPGGPVLEIGRSSPHRPDPHV